jgi:predicted ArsR family transcriptional regulator
MHNIRMTLESPLARRDVILGRLAQGQSVVAAALALEFEVSEDAIRRDLRALAAGVDVGGSTAARCRCRRRWRRWRRGWKKLATASKPSLARRLRS